MVRTAPSSQEGNQKLIRRQEVKRASSGQKGDEWPRGHEHSEQHRVARRALSGHEVVEWPRNRTDRMTSSR